MADALTVTAHRGDAKTLVAFDLSKRRARNLAGFTIECRPQGQSSYYLQNTLRYEASELHAQDASQSANSSLNAPFHNFRWLHVPGSLHQGIRPFSGPYAYVATPRYCDDRKALLPLDPVLSVAVDVDAAPLASALLQLGFTRGYTQSQGFVNNFGPRARIRPRGRDLLFDTSQPAGMNAEGTQYSYADEYEWLGFTAREQIFGLVRGVLADPVLRLDVFAYDLNEPDVAALLLELA